MPQREAEVVRAFADRLRAAGWAVDVEVGWVDVVATRGDRTLVAEAKGTTSAPGLDVDTGYGQLLRRMRDDVGVSYGLVVPDQVASAATRVPAHVLDRLDVSVYVVDEAGSIRLGAGPDTAGVATENRTPPGTATRASRAAMAWTTLAVPLCGRAGTARRSPRPAPGSE